MPIIHLYKKAGTACEYCFNIESARELDGVELHRLKLIFADGLRAETVAEKPFFSDSRVVEIGPRLNFATAWSSNMVSICRAAGLDCIGRAERSRRYLVPEDQDIKAFIDLHHDRMTECPYPEPLTSFAAGVEPEPVYEIDLKGKGADALLDIPGISMDEWDRRLYYDYFVKRHDRNPTVVEIMDLNNANSEHSRHGFFKGRQIIDGKEQPSTLFELVTDTLTANPKGSVVAFKDNSSVICGYEIDTILPEKPGQPAPFRLARVNYHPLLTAETHNFPTGVAPFPGAETGIGGRIRDVQATGKGGQVIAGTAGYCVGGLHIPDYKLSWEHDYQMPANLASPLNIIIEASNGASDYGNKFGEPLIQGFTRSFDMRLPGGERWAFLKPVMFTAGVGQIDHRHTEKAEAEKGMLIVQVGGPAYRVGFGGGAASSMLHGENASELDFDAVQRGDAEMEQKMNRVIRACNEMSGRTLIDVIHDQGAGGPANVLKELVEQAGGKVEISRIRLGDPTMSVLEIYVAEYQERCGFLIRPENINNFKAICQREKVGCEVLGEVTGDLRFVVSDARTGTRPVDIELDALLGKIPQKTFADQSRPPLTSPLHLPENLSITSALHDVLRLVSVGSKRFLTNKVDRSVTGLVAQQQCCGAVQLPVSDLAVAAQSHFALTGTAFSIGEQAVKMLLNPAAGARMAVGEALTNLVWAKIEDLEQIKCSANWMWAPKLPGEGAAIYDAARAMREVMIILGLAVDGGKDSLSMAAAVGGETVKSPRELVISAYAAMPDINRKITPDIKQPSSCLIFIDLADGKNRLGGSALAQVNGQLGEFSPDMDKPELLKRAFLAVQQLIGQSLLLSGHDRSDGGLITTLLEMVFAGNCGFELDFNGKASALEMMFSEELGLVVECRKEHLEEIMGRLHGQEIPAMLLGQTTAEKTVKIRYNGQMVLAEKMQKLRSWWEETSFRLELFQANPACVEQEKASIHDRPGMKYHLPFVPKPTSSAVMAQTDKPRVAILRDEGSNSDREMTAAFYAAGFEPWDVCMQDLLDEKIDLTDFRGLAAVGGFSYADVPESAKGWAAAILFNDRIKAMFDAFYNRPDTFSLGVCNGCQLFSLLGWVPWPDISAAKQPIFTKNVSGRFESRWATVRVEKSRAVMLKGMDGLIFGIHVDHGEGRLHFPDADIMAKVQDDGLAPMVYVDDLGNTTETYPFNPNGSAGGLAGLCSADGRHLALMPHPERAFLPWQAPYLPEEMKDMAASPWLKMFQNAYNWCQHK
ncbi:MAG: phosphoribosylformylglycinamidine synthase [Deltaproteobacteria bacterium]|nr:MAG: phosphoribosylformylglycinamidine synthase [Deltaproteobacteria bacterium]